jgi:hypothetical protein
MEKWNCNLNLFLSTNVNFPVRLKDSLKKVNKNYRMEFLAVKKVLLAYLINQNKPFFFQAY